MYYNGKGIIKDYTKALEWYLKATEKGNVDSIKEIAAIYETGGFGIKRDKKLAAEWLAKYETNKSKK